MCSHCTPTGSSHLYWLTCTHTHCSAQTNKLKKASLSFPHYLLPLISPQLFPLRCGSHSIAPVCWVSVPAPRRRSEHVVSNSGHPTIHTKSSGLLTPAAWSAFLSRCNFPSREPLPAVGTQTFQTISLLLTVLLPGKIPPQLTRQTMPPSSRYSLSTFSTKCPHRLTFSTTLSASFSCTKKVK